MQLQTFTVGRRCVKTSLDFKERRADAMGKDLHLPPWRQAALHKIIVRSGVHPAREIRKEDDSGRVTIAELDVNTIDSFFTHGSMLQFPVRPLCVYCTRNTVRAATVGIDRRANGSGS